MGADPRLRRDFAAPAGVCASGQGADSLRRDRAALAGCKALGLCGQVDVDRDVFSSCFQQCLSPSDRHRLVSDVIHGRCTSVALVCTMHAGVGMGIRLGLCVIGHVLEYMLILWYECVREVTC